MLHRSTDGAHHTGTRRKVLWAGKEEVKEEVKEVKEEEEEVELELEKSKQSLG